MSSERNRQLVTLSLVFGAVIFGMVLAGGLELTPASVSQESGLASAASPSAAAAEPVRPTGKIQGLPGFADLADQVSPAVVSIEAVHIERGRRTRGTDPFEFFFGPRGRQQEEQQEEDPQEFRSEAGGSGFVISPDGLVVTNYHVIDGATELRVHLGDRDFKAKVRGSDPATDLALLEIEVDHEIPYLAVGDSDALRVGDWVMAIGNPLRLQSAVTVGVVSGKGRQIAITPDSALENFIQTDAAINFGNSGGPLVNLAGEVVGINTAINFGSENIGFAVPANTLKAILPQLRDSGRVTRGYLGIQISDLDYDRMQAFGLDSTQGALVQNVESGTPAEDAGLLHGDILLKVDGRAIENTRGLIAYVANKPPGTSVKVDLVREGKPKTVDIVLGERPSVGGEQAEPEAQAESGIEWLGLQYQGLSDRMRQGHNLPDDLEGVIVSEVAPSSPLFEENVRPGDVISEVNGRPVRSPAELEEAVRSIESGAFVRLYVLRFDGRSSRPVAFFALARVP